MSFPLPRSAAFATLMVALSSVGFDLVPFFARSLTDAGIAAPAIALFRYMFPALAFLPFLRFGGREGRATLWGYGSGFVTGLGWIGYVKSLEMMPVSVAGVLYITYPLFTLLVAWAVFGEKPIGRAVLGSLLIVVAATLATRPSGNGTGLSVLAGGLLRADSPGQLRAGDQCAGPPAGDTAAAFPHCGLCGGLGHRALAADRHLSAQRCAAG